MRAPGRRLKVAFKWSPTTAPTVDRGSYRGILPDLFREGQGIVALGTPQGRHHGLLVADEVLAKHDENYMPPEVADATNGMHFKPEYTEAQLQGAKQ